LIEGSGHRNLWSCFYGVSNYPTNKIFVNNFSYCHPFYFILCFRGLSKTSLPCLIWLHFMFTFLLYINANDFCRAKATDCFPMRKKNLIGSGYLALLIALVLWNHLARDVNQSTRKV
jgi:hypothetical protein